ncbi:Hsp20/alpha crystallin family protein [Paenibacillus sp.]|uniref:Hsp20/alpha crystallin family protein n=1 Tax=Paenibacillus sp. TaxID=58172 RepID=UPI002D6B4A3B|nr:Hsp20/alpha crystallin family protein [Paenibacillus sp.]HZG56060.1 Hsp20/alpha crystallin family protein [Paenibacillus sp.]
MGNAWWKDPRFRDGWKSFESVVRRKLASLERSREAGGEYEWDRLVRECLSALETHRASGYTWDCFETFRSVIVRVTLPAGLEDKLPKLYVNERTLTLCGIPGKLDETIELPASVVPKKPRAAYANGIVEIRLRKKTAAKRLRRVRCNAKTSPSGG